MQSATRDLKKQKPTKFTLRKSKEVRLDRSRPPVGELLFVPQRLDDSMDLRLAEAEMFAELVLCLSLSSGHTCFSARCGNNYAIHYHRCLSGRRCMFFSLQSILRIFLKPSLLCNARTALMMTHSGTPWKKCASKRCFACTNSTESDQKGFKSCSMVFPRICLEVW